MNADYIDMLKCLNKAGVDYIMVGGWAVKACVRTNEGFGRCRSLGGVEKWLKRSELSVAVRKKTILGRLR